MTSIEDIMEKACEERDIPGAILVAADKSGKFRYEKAFGVRSLKDPSKRDPLQLDATMWTASCTKLMTTVAAMQCVERGQLNLDEDVSSILPELKGLDILKGFEEGTETPILVKNEKPITLRSVIKEGILGVQQLIKHLLTHSSGLGYDIFNPLLERYQKSIGKKKKVGAERRINEDEVFPLLFVPGEGWEYGVSIDWAGKMVERVNDNMTLDEYMIKYIWGPLGIKDFTFFPNEHPGVKSRLADISWRQGGVDKRGHSDNPKGRAEYTEKEFSTPDATECRGGAGGFGSPVEYQKLLQSLLNDDGKVLKPSSIDEMFKPQLSESAKKALKEQPMILTMVDELDAASTSAKLDWGIGGIMNLDDIPGRRRKGTLSWGGYPNLSWWIDRKDGLCGIYASQICPPQDQRSKELEQLWEKAIYERAKGPNGKL